MNFAQHYDLAVAWNWEYDEDFVGLIVSEAQRQDLQVLQIRPLHFANIMEKIKKGELTFPFILDRASDEEEAFQPLVRYIQKQEHDGESPHIRPINSYELQHHAADKATMHLEFLTAGIEVPYTIIISPYNHKKEIELSLSELAQLGRPFIIKPANTTGGGVGVVLGAETLKEVIEARQFHKNDKYLLQETIRPCNLFGKRAWFRVFYVFGEILPCWWDDTTHLYTILSHEEENKAHLQWLRIMTKKIYSVCRLDFFSTELVLTIPEQQVVVDYVNEVCDMRLQSKFADGVPDEIVSKIAKILVEHIRTCKNNRD